MLHPSLWESAAWSRQRETEPYRMRWVGRCCCFRGSGRCRPGFQSPQSRFIPLSQDGSTSCEPSSPASHQYNEGPTEATREPRLTLLLLVHLTVACSSILICPDIQRDFYRSIWYRKSWWTCTNHRLLALVTTLSHTGESWLPCDTSFLGPLFNILRYNFYE